MTPNSTVAIERTHQVVAYRPDIDGLRAIAVLSVIVYHAKLGLFPGGFVGVDVFFVISGYLIASIILKEEEKDSFSLARFYERRIRRIFPALFVVLLFCSALGAVILTPNDYLAFGRSAFAAMSFWSNFYFTRQGGYFSAAAETQPLLHTWSLGVEEQFYLVAPFVLLLLSRRLKRWRAPIFWALFAASLGVSAWGVHTEARWAFFLPHSRAFELMCGVALAMGLVPRAKGAANEALAAAGLTMILAAVFFYSAATPFPGFAALLPAVGAALLIHATNERPTIVARALSLPPVVYTGKISYSLYLWHWPLLAFAEYEYGHDLQAWHRALLLVAAVGLSAASYHFVEQPARRAGPPLTRRFVFAAGAAAILLVAGLSHIIVKGRGLPGRLDPQVAALARETLTRVPTRGLCGFEAEGVRRRESGPCFIGDLDAPVPTFAFWGDSHSFVVAPTLRDLARDAGLKGYFVGRGGCAPLFGLEAESSVFRKCVAGARDAERVLDDPSVRAVVLLARWGLYAEGVASLNEAGTTPRRFVQGDDAANRAAFARVLRATVERIRAAGKRVVIVGPVPEFELNVAGALVKAAMRGAPTDIAMPRAVFDARQRGVTPVLAEMARLEGVTVVWPHEQLCDAQICRGTAAGKALYVDDDHLSPAGAKLVEPSLRKALAAVAATNLREQQGNMR